MKFLLLVLAILPLAACGLPGTPPPSAPVTSSSHGANTGPQPANSLPPGDRVNGSVISGTTGVGAVTTRIGM